MDNLALGVENEGGFDGKGQPNSDKDGRFPPDICFDNSIECAYKSMLGYVRYVWYGM